MRTKGFTLIEVMVVLVILVILGLTIVGPVCGPMFFNSTHFGEVTENVQLGQGSVGIFAQQHAKEIAFSRAVSIETDKGECVTFSTIDRQFAVVQVGDLITVKVFEYPPWDIEKAGTLYNGRLLRRINGNKDRYKSKAEKGLSQ